MQTFTILLVDDDEDDYLLMNLFSKEIVSCQIQVEWVETYAEALRYVEQHPPDLLIVDYRLNSSRTGLDLVQELKQNHPDLPAVLVTAHSKDLIPAGEPVAILDGYICKNDLNSKILAEIITPFLV